MDDDKLYIPYGLSIDQEYFQVSAAESCDSSLSEYSAQE